MSARSAAARTRAVETSGSEQFLWGCGRADAASAHTRNTCFFPNFFRMVFETCPSGSTTRLRGAASRPRIMSIDPTIQSIFDRSQIVNGSSSLVRHVRVYGYPSRGLRARGSWIRVTATKRRVVVLVVVSSCLMSVDTFHVTTGFHGLHGYLWYYICERSDSCAALPRYHHGIHATGRGGRRATRGDQTSGID